MVPVAPALFSTTTGWPKVSESFCATVRASVSVAAPGGKGTMIFIGLVGNDWAIAEADNTAAAMERLAVLTAEAKVTAFSWGSQGRARSGGDGIGGDQSFGQLAQQAAEWGRVAQATADDERALDREDRILRGG